MVLKNLLFGLVSCCLICFSNRIEAQTRELTTLISYNIWNGFENIAERQQKFVRLMQQQNADIIALQELVGFNEESLHALARSYGHEHSAILKEEGYAVGITSRFPIVTVCRETTDFWHGMLHVKIKNLDVIITHLSPFEWRYRLKEANQIMNYIGKNKLDRCVIVGDLNAYSPIDADQLGNKFELKAKMTEWDAAYPQYGNLRNGHFDFSVLSTFMAGGFEDLIGLKVPQAHRTTYPTATLYGWEWSDTRRTPISERIDYILVSSGLFSSFVEATILNSPAAEGISDHYPVRATFYF